MDQQATFDKTSFQRKKILRIHIIYSSLSNPDEA